MDYLLYFMGRMQNILKVRLLNFIKNLYLNMVMILDLEISIFLYSHFLLIIKNWIIIQLKNNFNF